MKRILLPSVCLFTVLSGCSTPTVPPVISNVTPSPAGTPNSIASLGNFEFVSVQGTGQIFSYKLSSGFQVPVGPPYATPCADPSGMVIVNIGGSNVMAVVCHDTDSLLTLTVHSDGTLSPLGSISGLPQPYPGVLLDGTNVFVPLFGQSSVSNGGVARISIASPAAPVLTGMATLASPVPGAFANPGYMALSGGFLFLAAGSESSPLDTSSTIQVIDDSTMTLVGSPLPVAHSPQQIVIQAGVAYVTFFDAAQLESIDVSNPASLHPLQTLSLGANPGCHALSIVTRNTAAYVGCYYEGVLQQLDISKPADIRLTQIIANITAPQRMIFNGNNLLVASSVSGGKVYEIPLQAITIGGTITH